MLPLIMAACGAAGAVAGVMTTCSVKEEDKEKIKRYQKVNAELINHRDKLQQSYYKLADLNYELADRSKRQINDLNYKLAKSEEEKDLVYLALELYQELMGLREDIDINPSFKVLVEFHKAIQITNYFLKMLDRRLVPVDSKYFRRNLTRIDERDNFSKEQLLDFMSLLMNPQEDTVSSFLEEVEKEMFSQPIRVLEEQRNERDITGETEEEALEQEKTINSIFDEVKDWGDRGKKSLELEDYEEALTCYEKAIDLDPNNDNFWYQKSDILLNLERYQEALEAINKALKIDPEDDLYWYKKSDVLLNLERYEKALKAINKALNINPENDYYWSEKSDILYNLERYQEALKAINKALNINPEYDFYWWKESLIFCDLEEYHKALYSINQAIKLDSEQSHYWNQKTFVSFYVKEYYQSLMCADKAIALNPTNDYSWYCKSRALYLLDREQEAFEALDRSIAINPNEELYRDFRDEMIEYLTNKAKTETYKPVGIVDNILDGVFSFFD